MAGHILLAEDDKALSALMQDFFRAAGVTVTPAYDGEQKPPRNSSGVFPIFHAKTANEYLYPLKLRAQLRLLSS